VRFRDRTGLMICVLSAVGLLPARHAPAQNAADLQPTQQSDSIERLLDQLGDENYTRREEATRDLFAQGLAIRPRLEARLARETDPEIQHRLRYILENMSPPQQAVLVVCATPDSGLQPGTVITHANSRRVRDRSSLRQQLMRTPRGALLRVRGPAGPREIGPIELGQLTALCDYVAPRGEVLARAIRLYATGYAEQAYQVLCELPPPIPESELSRPLRARIAYTAGDGETALALMAGHADDVRATGAEWSSPSYFDLRGPGKAPFHLEWAVSTQAGHEFYATRNDPDLRIQRILLPARRRADALGLTAGYWWRQYRDQLGSDGGADHVGGNQLAVVAWMLYELDLRSECCRLIEPRSAILRQTGRGYRKWIRVETDAWLSFLAGDARAALDGFYEDALDVLHRPPRPSDQSVLTRNPQVAARVAFFLYQFPDDQRVEKALQAVSHHAHPALSDYLDWMLYALTESNQDAIRRDLQAALPHVPDDQVRPYARAVAILEYVQPKPDQDVLRTARRRVLSSPAGAERDVWLAITDALLELCNARPDAARRMLLPYRDRAETWAPWHTAGFLSDPPESAANHAALRQPVLVVPLGLSGQHWLILSRDRRLMHFDATASLLTAADRPTRTWFPNPLTWPWIGREEASGRVWTYGRRRVIEVSQDGNRDRVRVNLNTADIAAFDRYVGPRFSQFADAVAAVKLQSGENGEFLRSEIKAHHECVADPDLREIGMILALPQASHVVHVALRGGPHLLIDTTTGRSWTSLWIGEQLGLAQPPEFFAQALPEPGANGGPIVMLMSDQGLIRLELGTERVSRIALPGPEPYPPLVPESTPYERRDPRFVYCARLPEDGGRVYRLTLADESVDEVHMINEALPAHYYDLRLRSEIRAALDRRFAEAQLPDLQSFIADAIETVSRWTQEQEQQP